MQVSIQGRARLSKSEGRRTIKLWEGSPKGTTAATLLKHYLGVFSNYDAWESKKSELSRSTELTDIGKQRASLDYGFQKIVPDVEKGRRATQRARQEIETRRQALKMPKPDPSDAAGAIRRQEIRGFLRGLDHKARDQFLKDSGRLSGLDPEVLLALVEQPPALSGLLPSTHTEFVRLATDGINGEALNEIAELEKAVQTTQSALGELRLHLQTEAIQVDPGYVDVDRFERRVAEVSNLADPLWLQKWNEDGQEVIRAAKFDPGATTGSWVRATPEEIETGILASTRDEFERLKAAAPITAFSGGSEAENRAARVALIKEPGGVDKYLSRNNAA